MNCQGSADLADRRTALSGGKGEGGRGGAHLAELALGEGLLELGVRCVKQAVLQRHQDDVDALARQRLGKGLAYACVACSLLVNVNSSDSASVATVPMTPRTAPLKHIVCV